MNDERGQALIAAVFLLAIAAAAIGGLRVAQDRILTSAREHRAGESAAEAAAAVIADAYIAEMRRVASSTASPAPTADIFGAVTAAGAREAARVAAADLSVRNGGGVIDDVTVHCLGPSVEVALRLSGIAYRAAIAVSCSPR